MADYPFPLDDETKAERDSLAKALREYHANPGKYGLPVKEADNRWHLYPPTKPESETGYAKPEKEG